MLNKENNTSYTISVDLLVSAIAGQSNHKPSLYQQAKFYFETADANKAKLQLITDKIAKLKSELPHCSDTKAKLNANRIGKLEWDLDNETSLQQAARLKRLNNAISICMDILSLTEGDDFEETQKKSAKFLTTMALFSPGKGPHLAELHQSLKPAYKAVLSLRMLDKLMLNGMVKNTYMLREYSEAHRYIPESASNICYTQGVIIPIMLAAIFQDVGLQHPELGRLLDGEEGNKDRFRLLDLEERQKMLDLNYQFTIDYLVNGLGCQIADVGSKDEILAFSDAESKRLKFQLALVEGANLNKLGTSEIIKIPQIYASVIFSTKRDFSKKTLTTGSILIAQLAIKKKVSIPLANVLISIVGQFPLGYGIVYIPKDLRGKELAQYEYAIVTELNPQNSEQPICRTVSKNLIFVEGIRSEVVDKSRNMHFNVARKKLEKIDPKRLSEIMQKLTHDFKPEQLNEMVPYTWEPHKYFCIDGYQNLWSRALN